MIERRKLDENSLDAFLGGKIFLYQPLNGYRANIDSILLAASVNARAGQSVLELGCGVGAVLFALMSRVHGLNTVGIERQEQYARLAIRNAAYNGFDADILECDISLLPEKYKNLQYDHVILNPPYFGSRKSMRLSQLDKDLAKRERTFVLDDWLDVAIKRCTTKGEVTIIHQADRLAQILKSFDKKLGDVRILPVSSFTGERAKRVIVRGKKGSASPLQLLTPLIMHEGFRSDKLNNNYTSYAEGILRKGFGISWK